MRMAGRGAVDERASGDPGRGELGGLGALPGALGRRAAHFSRARRCFWPER